MGERAFSRFQNYLIGGLYPRQFRFGKVRQLRFALTRLSRVDIFLALSYEHLCELGEEEGHHHIDLGSLYGDGNISTNSVDQGYS